MRHLWPLLVGAALAVGCDKSATTSAEGPTAPANDSSNNKGENDKAFGTGNKKPGVKAPLGKPPVPPP